MRAGIQAIATTTQNLPPVPGTHATFTRDHEAPWHAQPVGWDRSDHRESPCPGQGASRKFIEFLKLLDAAYSVSTAIKLILDNHSAHISRETQAWLATNRPLRIHLHAEAWFLAQPHRGVLLKVHPLHPASYPGRLKTGTQAGSGSWRDQGRQPTSRCPHLILADAA
jgi:hypothetical protein